MHAAERSCVEVLFCGECEHRLVMHAYLWQNDLIGAAEFVKACLHKVYPSLVGVSLYQ